MISTGKAIAVLVVNWILPGVGSFIAGKNKEATWQLVLYIVGGVLCLTLVGIIIGGPLMLAGWIWALVTSIQLLTEAK